ncbi:hypothetical protein [Fusobacterium sp.]|nr:hypothetical protein [Fusobacterium sp.]
MTGNINLKLGKVVTYILNTEVRKEAYFYILITSTLYYGKCFNERFK